MKRFISPDELARDRRFKRSRARNQLLRSLPDDVDTVVRTLEKVAPKIRQRVEGTALEAVFDELGPGFSFLTASGGRQSGGQRSPLQLRLQLHGIYVGELQALEAAGRTLWDFPDAPWDFKMNMARQCWDEARHVQVFEKLIEHVDGTVGEFPESVFLFETSCADDPVLRVTGVNRCLEGLACDAFRSMIDYAVEVDDPLMAQALDFVLADELTHVRFGSEWVREFTKDDPEAAQRAKDFQRETDRRFSFGGGREIAREERLEAGFTEEELAELEAIESEGPRRETLVRAAEILRDRHQARQRGEEVPAL
ncbi:MAG: ferritin-like domain-containing protein [Proteobacteria bacterium]|nr:ferritin-like domain-containing protein [Pseudomonadota bacterium]